MKSVKKKKKKKKREREKISKQDNKMGILENVIANIMCQFVRATVTGYMVKYYGVCFCESIFFG